MPLSIYKVSSSQTWCPQSRDPCMHHNCFDGTRLRRHFTFYIACLLGGKFALSSISHFTSLAWRQACTACHFTSMTCSSPGSLSVKTLVQIPMTEWSKGLFFPQQPEFNVPYLLCCMVLTIIILLMVLSCWKFVKSSMNKEYELSKACKKGQVAQVRTSKGMWGRVWASMRAWALSKAGKYEQAGREEKPAGVEPVLRSL